MESEPGTEFEHINLLNYHYYVCINVQIFIRACELICLGNKENNLTERE